MPPKVQITREMVLNAAFDVVRAEGHERLNARRIAERLGCSTQPVLYNFKTVDEIREAVYKLADEYHTKYILPEKADGPSPMLSLGLSYIRFGHEERHLFRFLFQTNSFGSLDVDALLRDERLSPVLSIVAEGLGCDLEKARELFLVFFAAVHGYASLLANNAMEYDEKQSVKMLETMYQEPVLYVPDV